MRRSLLRTILAALVLGFAASANAQGTLPITLQQQFSFSGCASTPTTAACGQPLSGGLLYFYQVGTVATPQNSFQDTGLTILNPWPLVLDQNGRVPPFYLANGSIHVRLTDSSGVPQFDVPSMLVIGPSSGGGGGGGVDPTTIASTGDIKFRMTAETVTGWVKLNSLTIGNATSGATGRANADTQNLFVYLWTNCSNAHCPVSSGRGGTALSDFNANKTLQLPDWRARFPAGRDCMETSCAGLMASGNVTSGGGDGVDTAGAFGGLSTLSLAQNQLPNVVPTFSGSSTTPSFTGTQNTWALNSTNVLLWNGTTGNFNGSTTVATASGVVFPSGSGSIFSLASPPNTTVTPAGTISTITPAGTISSINGNVVQQAMLTMNPFILGSWYIKL